jgi:hypothetical protein
MNHPHREWPAPSILEWRKKIIGASAPSNDGDEKWKSLYQPYPACKGLIGQGQVAENALQEMLLRL